MTSQEAITFPIKDPHLITKGLRAPTTTSGNNNIVDVKARQNDRTVYNVERHLALIAKPSLSKLVLVPQGILTKLLNFTGN